MLPRANHARGIERGKASNLSRSRAYLLALCKPPLHIYYLLGTYEAYFEAYNYTPAPDKTPMYI